MHVRFGSKQHAWLDGRTHPGIKIWRSVVYLFFHVFFFFCCCCRKEAVNFWWTSSEQRDHLAVGINYRSEQLPGASTTIHTQHAQDLQESQTPDGRGSKNIALRAGCEHWHWSDQHHHVWRKKEKQRWLQDSEKLYVMSAWINSTLLFESIKIYI